MKTGRWQGAGLWVQRLLAVEILDILSPFWVNEEEWEDREGGEETRAWILGQIIYLLPRRGQRTEVQQHWKHLGAGGNAEPQAHL